MAAAVKSTRIYFEGCIDSVASALEAQKGGADRVELCSGLVDGGLSPSIGLIRQTVAALKIPVNVFLRPRPGDFCYSETELQVIEHDILACRQVLGLHGVVIGVLTPSGAVDMKAMRRLLSQCGSLFVSFSRAIDYVPDPVKCLKDLLVLNKEFPQLRCILTSGQKNNVFDGADVIAELVRVAAGSTIDIMAGAGLTEANCVELVARTGVRWIHGSLRNPVPSAMKYQKPDVFLGGPKANSGLSEYTTMVCDNKKVTHVIKSVNASLKSKL